LQEGKREYFILSMARSHKRIQERKKKVIFCSSYCKKVSFGRLYKKNRGETLQNSRKWAEMIEVVVQRDNRETPRSSGVLFFSFKGRLV
jgi:hypothetical protein